MSRVGAGRSRFAGSSRSPSPFEASKERLTKISVVIPTFQRRQILARTLPTVLAQDFPADAYEVVVAVDGSTDGTVQMLRDFKPDCALRIVEQPNQGQGVAKNAGAAVARGDLLLFLDDDIVCDRTLLREHLGAHALTEHCAVFGPVYPSGESPRSLPFDLIREVHRDYFQGLEPGIQPPFSYPGITNISLPRGAFLHAGGFDQAFSHYYEDRDLGLRLGRLEYRFCFQPNAVTYQIYTKTAREFVRGDASYRARYGIRLARKYPELRPRVMPAYLSEGPLWKRLGRAALGRLPASPEPFLEPPFRVAERLRAVPPMRHLAASLLRLRTNAAGWRSACAEAGSWAALRREFGITLPVLAYHHVGTRRSGLDSERSITPERLARDLGQLKRQGFTGITPSDWLRWRREATPLPDKPVLMTFDHGCEDLGEFALPLLQRHGFRAAVFVVTGAIGRSADFDQCSCGCHCQSMMPKEIRAWAGRGIEFGSHGRTHRDPSGLPPGEELEEEIASSADDLARITGVRPVALAYPCGYHNRAVRTRAAATFELGFTACEGRNTLLTDPHALMRTRVLASDSPRTLALRARFGRPSLFPDSRMHT